MAIIHWSLTFIASFICIVASFPQVAEIKVISVDKDQATLKIIKTGDSGRPGSLPCTLHYVETGGSEDKYVELITNKDQETVALTGLQTGTSYTATLQCNSNKSVVKFETESSDDEVKETPDEAVYKDKQLFSATTLDIVLGVLFGIVALVIVVVTLLYLFRRRQRRQRLRNFLSTPHTDPFESLQDYVE